MSILLIALGVIALLLVLKNIDGDGATKIRPSFREGLAKDPTPAELIAHAEKFWTGKKLPLGDLGEITACVGRSTYVWRDKHGKATIVCHKCACALAAKVYSSKEEPLETSAGTVHGLSRLSFATLTLKSMWFYTNHYYIITHRGGLRAMPENLGDPYPCSRC